MLLHHLLLEAFPVLKVLAGVVDGAVHLCGVETAGFLQAADDDMPLFGFKWFRFGRLGEHKASASIRITAFG